MVSAAHLVSIYLASSQHFYIAVKSIRNGSKIPSIGSLALYVKFPNFNYKWQVQREMPPVEIARTKYLIQSFKCLIKILRKMFKLNAFASDKSGLY